MTMEGCHNSTANDSACLFEKLTEDLSSEWYHNGTDMSMLPLLERRPLLSLVYISILAVALFIGTIGNTITVVVSFVQNVNKVGKEFIINLALSDICVACFADPMCILAVVKGQVWFNKRSWFCEFISSVCLTACFCAFFNLTMVSVNRYIYVCKNEVYHKLFRRKNCIVVCIICWIVAFFMQFPNIVGWGDHVFDEKSHQCIWDRTFSLSYTLFVSIVLIGSPLFIMFVTYMHMFYYIYQTKVSLYTIDSDDPDRLRKVWLATLQSSRTLFILFIVFVICWTPYAVVIVIDVDDVLPMEIHLFVTLLAHLHSSSSFIVYMLSNQAFRQAVVTMFKEIIHKRVPDSEQSQTATIKLSSIS